MKPITIFMATSLLASTLSWSQVMTNTSTNKAKVSATALDVNTVPVAIRTSFTTKYPNAGTVYWYRYTPPAVAFEKDSWMYPLDATDYYTTFTWNDVDYVAWYDNGNWIRTTSRVDDSELPQNVRGVIDQQYPGYVITDIEMGTDNKQSVYEVKLEKGDQQVKLHLGTDGSIVKKKTKTLDKITPQAVMVTDFDTRYPNAEDVVWYSYSPREYVTPADWDYNMDASDYEVHYVSDGTSYITWYDNGTWVRTETLSGYEPNRLPATINSAVNRDYPGYTITDIDLEEKPDKVVYEVELKNATQKCKIHYGTDGSIVRKKCRDLK